MSIQTQIMEVLLDNISFTNDPSKVMITLDDIKYIPELSKIISFEKIVQNKYVTFENFHDTDKEKIIFIYLKKYNFIQKFEKKWYFNYTKMLDFWPKLSYYIQIFENKTPDFKIISQGKEQKFYAWDDITLSDKIYIGYMFFSAFNKIKNTESINEKEFEFFTDIYLQAENLNMIENFEIFFLRQFSTFINTNNGVLFGDYSFGSNLKAYIQNKNNLFLIKKIENDIYGFINDLSILYNNSLELLNFGIKQPDDYSLQIILIIKINDEIVQFEIKKS